MSLKIDISFPAGNVFVENINGFEVMLTRDLRNTDSDWFYWAFRGTFDEPGTYHFQFSSNYTVGARGPAVSYDDGFTWDWLGADAKCGTQHNAFVYTFDGSKGSRIIFSMNLPYNQCHLDAFLDKFAGSPYLSQSTLALTRKGRRVVKLHIEDTDCTLPKKRIFLSSRHHCCESMATYGLEGILIAALGNDELAETLRRRYIFDAVPFMDTDGVIDGDQGKNRRPHDHNRDYCERPLYPEVAETMKFLKKNPPYIFMDMHCPWILFGCNETIFFPGPMDKSHEKQLLLFSSILEKKAPADAPHRSSDNVLFGTSWNTEADKQRGLIAEDWVWANLDVALSTSMEIAYANAREITLYPDSIRRLGRALAECFIEFEDRMEKEPLG